MSNGREETKSMALFCDFENVALGVKDARYRQFDIKKVLERLLLKGSIVVKKAYCDWERYREFKAAMHQASFELIEIPHVRMSGKNSADIRMVVDALDLCYTKSHVDTFVIISGDSDFSPLVSKLRENNKTVIGVGVKNSTSDLLIANCDEFIYYDDLVREQPPAAAARGRARPAPVARGVERAPSRTDERSPSRNDRPVRGQITTPAASAAQGEPSASAAIVPVIAATALQATAPDAVASETAAATASPARTGGRRRGGGRTRPVARATELADLSSGSVDPDSTTLLSPVDGGAVRPDGDFPPSTTEAAEEASIRPGFSSSPGEMGRDAPAPEQALPSEEPGQGSREDTGVPSSGPLEPAVDAPSMSTGIPEPGPVAKTRARRTPVRRKTAPLEEQSPAQDSEASGLARDAMLASPQESPDAPVPEARPRKRSARAAAPMAVSSGSAGAAAIVPGAAPDHEALPDLPASESPMDAGEEVPPAAGLAKPKRAPRRRKAAAEVTEEAVSGAEAQEGDRNRVPDPGAAPSIVAYPDSVPRHDAVTRPVHGGVAVAPEPVHDSADDRASAASSPTPSRSGEDRALEALDLVVGTIEALVTERGDADRIWGSMVKQTLKRRRPGFNESYYGYRSFNQLLEDARDRGMIELERDEKSGGYTVRSLA